MLSNVTFPNPEAFMDYFSQAFPSQGEIDPQTATGYTLLALATYAISSRILNVLRYKVWGSGLSGKISEITWETPEGKTSVYIKGQKLAYTVQYSIQTPSNFSGWKTKKKEGDVPIPRNLRPLSLQEQLKSFKDFEVSISKDGEPNFLEPMWLVKHLHNFQSSYTLEIKKTAKGNDIFVEITKANGDKIVIPKKNLFFKAHGYPPNQAWPYATCLCPRQFEKIHDKETPRLYPPQIERQEDLYKVSLFEPAEIVQYPPNHREPIGYVPSQNKRYYSLDTNNNIMVFFVPRNQPSRLDKRFLVSEFWWGISTICFKGPCGNHTRIIIEGVDHGKYFTYMGHRNSQSDIKFKDWTEKKNILSEKRSKIYKIPTETAKKLISILKDMKKNPTGPFSILGSASIWSYGKDNCYTWAVKVIRAATDIWLPCPLQPTPFAVMSKDYMYSESELKSLQCDEKEMLKV